MQTDIIRAWQGVAYQPNPSTEEHTILPVNTTGEFELTDIELETIYGGQGGVVGGLLSSVEGIVDTLLDS